MTTNIEKNGWDLRSAVDRHRSFPDTFHIPSEHARTSLQRGDAAKILVDIETKENGEIVDRGTHRMWVIVIAVLDDGYTGVLDSDPGSSENLNLSHRDVITFNAEHICQIDQPPKDFLLQEYAQYFQ